MTEPFGSSALSDEAEAIFVELRREPVDAEYVRSLVAGTSVTLDESLAAVIQAAARHHEAAALASRILVERDPNRSPDFLPDFIRPVTLARSKGAKGLARFTEFFLGEPPPSAFQFGYSRLRSVDALGDYTRMAKHRFSSLRYGAMLGLADTADLAALDPLARGLDDRSPRVREAAANAVRRLRHAGPVKDILAHQVHQKLIQALSDRSAEVRIAAARALGALGDHDALRKHSHALRGEQTELDQILNNRIPPLDKIWPLDDTT
ncbi:HEAT repeat domain-containing protein [Amycolatopsis sp. cmx-4-54]|uniref:HEAT repeat domain-containing protein n=1 Tax=Amycolatopsis sp. cmx-4-54 TaxID=2790936 RepID=UPI0039787B56